MLCPFPVGGATTAAMLGTATVVALPTVAGTSWNVFSPVRSHDGQEVQRESAHEEPKITTLTYSVDNLLLNSEEHKPRNGPRKSLTVPFISVIEAEPKRCDEEPSTSQRIVHFSDEEASDTDA
ncbi:hypothetical protein Q1695_006310 [Nippostrongylus brasiliensis]|nr:hypothetical protein Q1695_006310 [Nippostrongylus brasiliensis]